MLRIRREKGKATHYATAVTSRGTIDGWSADPKQAVAVTDGVVHRVREYHRTRANVGELHCESIDATAGAALAKAVSAADAVGAAEFAAMQTLVKKQQGRIAELEAALEKAKRAEPAPAAPPPPQPETEKRPVAEPSVQAKPVPQLLSQPSGKSKR